MAKHFYFDIETRANPQAAHLIPLFEAREAKSAAKENRPVRDVIPALWPQLSQVVAIAWALDNHPPESMVSDDEPALLLEFMRLAYDDNGSRHKAMVCFNGAHFDLPTLQLRAASYGLAHPFIDPTPWKNNVIDLFKVTQYMAGGSLGLKLQCQSWGIEPLLPDVDGSKLPDDPVMLGKYAESDVHLLRELHKFYILAGLVKG